MAADEHQIYWRSDFSHKQDDRADANRDRRAYHSNLPGPCEAAADLFINYTRPPLEDQ